MEKLLWIDMEMTGLDVEKEVVIEVAAIVTDLHFAELAAYHSVVKQPSAFLEQMDDWNKQTHGSTGLTAKVPHGKEPSIVEDELIRLIDENFGKDRPVIAGNSIGQDRLFINRYFKRLAARLHYRMLDVTAWKIIMQERFGLKHEKRNTHQALDDIRESISELAFYTAHIVPSSK